MLRKTDGEGFDAKSATHDSIATSGEAPTPGGAESGAVDAREAILDPGLAGVTAAWPHLDETAQRTILEIVRKATPRQ